MTYVAAFRTYAWDDSIAELARRFFAACPSGRHVVLADKSHGPLAIEGYEVIWHTHDTAYLDLPEFPKGKSPWYNVDYGLYMVRHALPGYDYYLLSESDIAVNLSLEPMMDAVQSRRIDMLAHDLRQPPSDWVWYDSAVEVFPEIWTAMFFFMAGSARAADMLLKLRQEQGVAFQEGRLSQWPFCEPFVASALKQAGMNILEVGEFAETSNLNHRPRLFLGDDRANQPGSLAHSVIGGPAFLKAAINEFELMSWFDPASAIRAAVKAFPFSDVLPMLLKQFTNLGDAALFDRFRGEFRLPETIEDMSDLAFCKPAIVSSVCEWSRSQHLQIEAGGANGPIIYDDFGFHTSSEFNPWWSVDLLDVHPIRSVVIVNRKEAAASRFVNFVIQCCDEGNAWVTRHIKIDSEPVSSDPEAPYVVRFPYPVAARFVRILMPGQHVFHLRRIQIFGT